MNVILYDYQEAAVAAIEAAWSEGINRPAVVMATGSGKTTVFADLIGRHMPRLRKEGKRILLVAHREELLDQAEKRVKLQNPDVWTTVVKGNRGWGGIRFADVVVASVQTLARPKRRDAVDRIGMVIVDESHNAASQSYRDVLDHYGCLDGRQTPTVGFTATLTRMSGGLPEVWQSVAFKMPIHELIKRGFLVPPVAKSVSIPGFNISTTRVTAGDLNTRDIAATMDDSAAYDIIADAWLAEAADPGEGAPFPHRPTIVFMPNVDTCLKLRSAFAVRGVTADVVVGTTATPERKASFERFRTGAAQLLIGAMVMTEGFDAPATSCVIIGRPTINPGLYIQMVGRGLRLAPGKSDCLVLDIAGASHSHSLAGVNDLESDCEGVCDCNCLSCGCTGRCKCGIRACGCTCVVQHKAPVAACRCAGDDSCTCGCPGETVASGTDAVLCLCDANPGCACRGDGSVLPDKEVSADDLRILTAVDILGEELSSSEYNWIATAAGIRFLPVGKDANVFLLPDPDSDGYFQGLVEGSWQDAPVKRLDTGPLPVAEARAALEAYAAETGFPYNARKASWRRTPANEAQKGLLTRLGAVFSADIRKGAASDLLSSLKVSGALDARFGKYARGAE